MSFIRAIYDRVRRNKKQENVMWYSNIKDVKIKTAIADIQKTDNINQFVYYLWYKGDSDYLKWYYTYGNKKDGILKLDVDGYRNNDHDYFWAIAGREKDIKRTHSGLPRAIINILDRSLSFPLATVQCNGLSEKNNQDHDRLKVLNEILDENDFYNIFSKQNKMMMVIGDGAYIVNVDKKESEFPIIEFFEGRNVSFEFVGERVKAIVICRHYSKEKAEYECFERRSTVREYDEATKTYTKKATIEYTLFECSDDRTYKEVPLDTLEETENLENLKFNNIDIMMAVPVIFEPDEETKRGTSIFKAKIDLFDDFNQNISQEANIMKAITPVEYIDSNLLDRDGDGKAIEPNSYGKRFIMYKGAKDYNQTPNQPNSVFYDIDFNKLTAESLETLNRCLAGLISPATLGLELARNSTELSQREKEKVTLQTLKKLGEVNAKVLKKLFDLVLRCYDIMQDENADIQKNCVSVKFQDYGTPTFDSKLQSLMPAVLSGAISVEGYVEKLYGDNISNEEREREIEYIEKTLNQRNGQLEDIDPYVVE